MNRMLAIAHRGYSARYPENSLLSYQMGIEAKADLIETDVRLSSDGIAIAAHDYDLSRMTGHTGEVANLSEDEIQDLGVYSNAALQQVAAQPICVEGPVRQKVPGR